MLVGVGRSIRAPLAIFIRGCVVRIGLFIYFLCRKGPFEMLVIFTTTIRAINRYRAIRMVNVPFGWLYSFLVIVVISFSVIVLNSVVSFLLIVVLSLIVKVINIIAVAVIIIFVDKENISFDASLAT
jgi:hypothetical protein